MHWMSSAIGWTVNTLRRSVRDPEVEQAKALAVKAAVATVTAAQSLVIALDGFELLIVSVRKDNESAD